MCNKYCFLKPKRENYAYYECKEPSCSSQGQSHGNAQTSHYLTVDSSVREGSYWHVYTQDTERVLGEVQCELGHRGVAMQLNICVFLLLSMADIILQWIEYVFKWNDDIFCLSDDILYPTGLH